MGSYSRADDYGDKQFSVADLDGEIVAIRPSEIVEDTPTKFGDRTCVWADTWTIHPDTGAITELGRVPYFAQVLVEKLTKVGIGNWIVDRIGRPGKAWVFIAFTDDEEPAVARAMAILNPDDEEPF